MERITSHSSRWRRLTTLLFAFAIALSACSASDDDASTEAASATTVAASMDEAMEEEATEEAVAEIDTYANLVRTGAEGEDAIEAPQVEVPGAPAQAPSQTPNQPVDIGRDIIFTASVAVEVDDVAAATQQATTAVQGLGGLVFGQETNTEGVPRATITYKVRPQDFQEALDRIGNIGTLRDQRITTDDVTERVVDLQSQIITSELSVERLRGFLEGATSLTDIAELERQLLERETALERLRGQLRTVQNQVSLATITVSFTQIVPGPEVLVETGGYLGHDEGAACPGFDEVAGDEGDLLTICYRIENTGDTLLGDINIVDDGLGLDLRDLDIAAGTLDEPLGLGESVVLFAEVDAEPFTRSRVQVTASPVDADGNDLRTGQTAAQYELPLDIEEDTSLPGFGNGLDAGLDVLTGIVGVIVVASGFLLPFVWLLPVLWVARRWQLKRRAQRAEAKREAAAEAARHIPPPFSPAPPTAATQPDSPQTESAASDSPER